MEQERIEGEDQYEPQMGLPLMFSPFSTAGWNEVAPPKEIIEHFDFANILDTIKLLREKIKHITEAYDARGDVMIGLYGELDRLRLDNMHLRDELIRMRDIVGPLVVPDTPSQTTANPFRDFSGVDRRRVGG
jgi:hypothetical protein